MVLLTDTAEMQALKCLQALGIQEGIFDDGIYGSSFLGEDLAKPMPEAFEKVCADIGVEPSDCIIFEDSLKNLQTCVEILRMHGIFLSGQTLEMERREQKSINRVLEDNKDAVVVVDRLNDLRSVTTTLFEK